MPWTEALAAYRRFLAVRAEHGLEVEEFFDYKLWRRDLEEARWRSFIGWRKHILILRTLNPVRYRCLTEDKLLFHRLCERASIPTPRLLALLDPAASKDASYRVLHAYRELPALLVDQGIEQVVIKPVNGTRGQSIQVLRHLGDGRFLTADGDTVSTQELQARAHYTYRGVVQSSFLVQERVMPHPQTAQLSPDCPLSYRVHTILEQSGEVGDFFVYAKLPATGSITDNFANGGLICLLDDGGRCYAASSSKTTGPVLKRHPEFDFDLVGWRPPFFAEVRALARRLATAFPQVRCVAWDIAVGRDGPLVFEGNNPWNPDIQLDYDEGLWKGRLEEISRAALTSSSPTAGKPVPAR